MAASIVASNDLDEEKLYELRDKVFFSIFFERFFFRDLGLVSV